MFVLISGLMLILAGPASADKKPTVSVYYESLCPDSIAFVTKQLFPSYSSPMRSYYNLQLVPYGKSKLKGGHDSSTWEFECHHGPRECYGNKVHGCALEQFHDLEKSLRFIVCLMKRTLEDKSAPYPVDDCASQNGINSRDIISCANTTRGVDVLKKNQEMTDRLMTPLSSVPTVVFDNHFDKQVQDMSVRDFSKTLCKHLDNPPHECMHSGSGASSVAAISLAFLVLAPFLV